MQMIGFFWENYGPTHFDRCDAVVRSMPEERVVCVQWGSTSNVYGWVSDGADVDLVTLFPGNAGWQGSQIVAYWRLVMSLRKCRHVFLCHFNKTTVLLVAITLRLLGCRVYSMIDSKFDDFQRFAWREAFKTLWLKPYNGIISASRRSASFMMFLGVKPKRILLGYDTLSLDRIRDLAGAEPAPGGAPFSERHFIIIARFVPKKNLVNALRAYARYAELDPRPRPLQLFGGGELEGVLRALIDELGIGYLVNMHGFVQSDEICRSLGRSLALVLFSVEEQFGLAVLEAQAVGLPVIVSDQCGVRDDFVRTGVNGFVVEPDNIEGAARAMLSLAQDEGLWRTMAEASARGAGRGDARHFAEAVRLFVASDGGDVTLSGQHENLVPLAAARDHRSA